MKPTKAQAAFLAFLKRGPEPEEAAEEELLERMKEASQGSGSFLWDNLEAALTCYYRELRTPEDFAELRALHELSWRQGLFVVHCTSLLDALEKLNAGTITTFTRWLRFGMMAPSRDANLLDSWAAEAHQVEAGETTWRGLACQDAWERVQDACIALEGYYADPQVQ